MMDLSASDQQASFNRIGDHLIVALPNNLDADDVSQLEDQVLDQLNLNKRIRGVIVDFAAVHSTDPGDLARLNHCLLAVRLLGRQVRLCGINPGVAAVTIRSGQQLHHDRIGFDIDDLLGDLDDD